MIRLEHVSKRFEAGGQTVEAVKDVSLHIEKGSIAGIIGFSGAGKSTLLYALSGMDSISGGTVDYTVHPVTGLSDNKMSAAASSLP